MRRSNTVHSKFLSALLGAATAAVVMPSTNALSQEAASSSPGGGRGLVVTIGAWTIASPAFEGAEDMELGVRPLLNIRREGASERVKLPGDNGGVALFETTHLRLGPSLNHVQERDQDDSSQLRGLRAVDWAIEAGAFAEYWPTDFLRTRIELRRGFHGHEGIVADLSADAVWRPNPSWIFTLGPRLSLVDEEYMSTYFSVSPAESNASRLQAFDPQPGLKSAGAGASLTYKWSERIATTLYVEYARLLGDAARSPIVDERGSPDQLTVGLGVSYSFVMDAPSWRLPLAGGLFLK